MKKLFLAAVAVGTLGWSGPALASDPITTPGPLSQEGCVAGPGDTCTYTATRTGGYAAGGSSWSLVVAIPTTAGDPRDVNADGVLTYTFGPSNAPPQGCSLWGAGATAAVSGAAAGNPFPAPADSARDNTCAGGMLPDRTDATPQ